MDNKRKIAFCSACGAQIYWLKQADKPNAKANPITVKTELKGNITVDLAAGTYKIVAPGEGQHVSHFADCPKAQRFKAAKPKASQ